MKRIAFFQNRSDASDIQISSHDEAALNINERKTRVNIIALHLGVGGVEKAIISMANLFVQRYDVHIYSVYNLPGTPLMPIDERVCLHFLLDDVPNREEWKAAVKAMNPAAIFSESLRSIKVLRGKRDAVKAVIKSISEGVIITTRHEDNIPLAKYGARNVLKIGQLHLKNKIRTLIKTKHKSKIKVH